jgi:hypothetical protein
MQCIQVGALCNGNLRREKLGRRPNPTTTKETLGLHHEWKENPVGLHDQQEETMGLHHQ